MALSEKEKELVAIGASIGGNCIPCLEYHYKKCMEFGYTREEMQEAIDMAKKVKETPNKEIYKAAAKLALDEMVDESFSCCLDESDCDSDESDCCSNDKCC
jgi:AhpD family alkylhydroperoxidase